MKVAYLDGWRGLAIGAVLFDHFFNITGLGFKLGRLGVDLFFVLSGLLMSRILYEDRVPLSIFYRRRISRIFPVFALYVGAMICVAWIADLPFGSGEALATLAFLRTYLPPDLSIWQSAVPIGHLWSLNVEEHSYVLLASIASIPLMRRREGWLLIGLALLTMVAYMAYYRAGAGGDFELRTECAATGLLVSAGYRQVKHHFERFVLAWMPIAAFAIGVFCYSSFPHELAKTLIAPVALAFCVNHLDLSYSAVRRLLESRALVLLGIWSYSLYIWQQPFYELKAVLPISLLITLTFMCALASFYLYEAPARDWLNKSWSSKRSASGVPIGA